MPQPASSPRSGPEAPPEPPALWQSYVELMRLPNVFTALADVIMGAVVAWPSGPPIVPLVLLAGASACLYLGGIVLNDVFDFDLDGHERPERPLPSGRISLVAARRLGWGLLAGGVVLGLAAGIAVGAMGSWGWRPPLIAVALAGMIVAYNGWLKRTFVGPVAMGSCRFLNVLLGLSMAPIKTGQTVGTLGFDEWQWLIACGMGLYVAGITLFAKYEADRSPRLPLWAAVGVMTAGLIVLARFPALVPFDTPVRMTPDFGWPLMLSLIGFHLVIGLRFASPLIPALRTGRAEFVRPMVGRLIFGIVWLDAAIASVVAVGWAWPIVIVSLLIPRLVLSRINAT